MLSHILPGLRDFRTPFASGVLWLLLAWLLIEPNVDRAHPQGIYASIQDLDEALKPLGLGAGLTLVAYLAGSITEVLWNTPLQRLAGVSRSGVRAIATVVGRRLDEMTDEETVVFAYGHSYSARQVMARVDGREVADGMPRPVGSSSGPPIEIDVESLRAMAQTASAAQRIANALQADLTQAVRQEIDVTATRLLAEETKQQFDIYDRLRSEAEFRIAIAAPVAGLTYVLVDQAFPKLAAGVIAAVVGALFVSQARNRRLAAGDRIADALLLKVIEAPSLEQTSARSYTFDAFDAGEVRAPRAEAFEREVYGVPFHRRVRIAVVYAAETVMDVAEPAIDRVGSVLSLLPRALRALWRRFRGAAFAMRDRVFNRGRVVRAIRQLQPELRRGSPHARIALGDAFRSSGYARRARREYRAVNNTTTAFRIAEMDLEHEYRDLVRHGYVMALPDLVDLYAAQDRLEEAWKVCVYVVALGFPEAKIPLGDVLRALGRPLDAENAYRAAAKAGKATGLTRLGDMYLRHGRLDEAEATLLEAIDRGAESARATLAELRKVRGRGREVGATLGPVSERPADRAEDDAGQGHDADTMDAEVIPSPSGTSDPSSAGEAINEKPLP